MPTDKNLTPADYDECIDHALSDAEHLGFTLSRKASLFGCPDFAGGTLTHLVQELKHSDDATLYARCELVHGIRTKLELLYGEKTQEMRDWLCTFKHPDFDNETVEGLMVDGDMVKLYDAHTIVMHTTI